MSKKITAAASPLLLFILMLALTLTFVVSCSGPEENPDEGDNTDDVYDPYPYDDLSVFMDLPAYNDVTITEKDIEKYIHLSLADVFGSNSLYIVTSDRAAQEWDRVKIDFTGYMDGETFDGGSAKDYLIVLGSDMFIPGFEEGVLGMQVGEVKDIELKFPDDYYEGYAGKEVIFSVTLKEIGAPPEVDDEFCKKYTYCSGSEEMYSMLREECLRNTAWDTVLSRCKLKEEQPQEYTEYYQSFVSMFNAQAQAQNMSLSDFVEMYGGYYTSYGLRAGMSLNEFYAVAKNYADSNVANDLLLYSIIRKEGLKTEGADYDSALQELLSRYPGQSAAELEEEYGKTVVITSVMNIQVLRLLASLVTVTE